MRRLLALALVSTALAGCAAASADTTSPPPPVLGDGYLTIDNAPPTPWPRTVPEDRTIGHEDMFEKFARENGLTLDEAMAAINGPPELHEEFARIRPLIEAGEAGNFGGFVMVRDPAVRMEVWFERDADATLARYTDSPLFVAREGGLSQTGQEELSAIWQRRLEGEHADAFNMLSYGADGVEVGVAIPEAEFRALAAAEGWELGPRVKLLFAQPRPPAFADPALASTVRVFPREHRQPGMRNLALFTGKIVLDDGCFRLERPDGDNPLALFAYETFLDRDEEGYLIVNTEGGEGYRIGEVGNWGGPAAVIETNPDVAALREACGGGEIVNVTSPTSARLFSLPSPEWVTDYAEAKSMTRQAAWDEIVRCMDRQWRAGRQGLDARDACIRQFN